MAFAFYLQYVEGLEPCPLCQFQRACVIGMGLVFLVAGYHNPGRTGATVYALLQLVIGGAGVGLRNASGMAAVAAEGPGPFLRHGHSNYMLENLPFIDVLKKVFEGSGECAEKGWEFLGLSIAGWTLVFFIAMIVTAFAVIRRD